MRTNKGGQSALLLLDAVEILRGEQVDYAVIGAFALAVLGVVRATTDVDALLFAKPGRLAKLEKQFRQKGFHTELLGGLRNMDPEIFSRTLEISFRDEKLRIVGREAADKLQEVLAD